MRLKWTFCAVAALMLSGCNSTTHTGQIAGLGKSVSEAVMELHLDQPGPVELETVASADWTVPLSGLVNLDDPKAAALKDRAEPISVFVHVLRHPQFGTFLVDTGVSEKIVQNPGEYGFNLLLQKVMKLDQMRIRKSTADIVASLPGPLSGVFFTHLHLDHVSGLPDLPANVQLYVGKGEAGATHYTHAFTRGATDRMLAGKGKLQEWPFEPRSQSSGQGGFEAVLDVFGDGSVFAIHVPGHTPGSTAYLVRSTRGPVLLVGDTSHTKWGWDNSVEPGSFTRDHQRNRDNLLRLKTLAMRHPGMQVRLGHQ